MPLELFLPAAVVVALDQAVKTCVVRLWEAGRAMQSWPVRVRIVMNGPGYRHARPHPRRHPRLAGGRPNGPRRGTGGARGPAHDGHHAGLGVCAARPAIGEPAPDFELEASPGRKTMLKDLGGRSIVVAFWTVWSEPSLAELTALRKRLAGNEDGPLVLAVNDGDDEQRAATIFKQRRLPFTLVTDPPSRTARSYGVSCWPTLVSVDPAGFVAGVHHGRTPDVRASQPGVESTDCQQLDSDAIGGATEV